MKVITAIKQSVDWFIPLEYREEEFQQCRARIVVSFSFFLSVWGPLFAAAYYFTPNVTWGGLGCLVATLMLVQVPFTLRYSRSLALAGNCFILNVFLLVCYLSYAAGGHGAPPLAWNTALPMFAIAIVGYRYGLLWAAITLLTFSAFYGYEQLGYQVARHMTDAQLNAMNFVGLCGLLLLILSMTMLYESHQNRSERILKLANDKLAETSGHLHAIVDCAADGILTFDTSGIIKSFNPAAERLFAYKAADVIGQPLKRLMPLPSSVQDTTRIINRLKGNVARDAHGGQRTIAQRKGGQSFPLDVAVGKAFLDDKPLFICILRDVTELVIAEEQQQQFTALIEHSSDFIAMASLDNRMSYLNAAGRKLLGISSDAEVGDSELPDYLTEQTWAELKDVAMQVVMKDAAWDGEGQLQHFVTGMPIGVHLNIILVRHLGHPDTLCIEAVPSMRWTTVTEPVLSGVA